MSGESWPAKTTWSHPPMTEMRWQWLDLSNWAHLIETEERSVMGCGWSLAVLITCWDRSTSDVDNVCVNSCDELRILLIVKIKQEERVFYHSVRAFVRVYVCVCVFSSLFVFVYQIQVHKNSMKGSSKPAQHLSRPGFRAKNFIAWASGALFSFHEKILEQHKL